MAVRRLSSKERTGARRKEGLRVAEGPVIIHRGADIVESDPVLSRNWRARHGSTPAWAAAILELRPERIFSFDGTLE